ncbi:MAG: hypothetical protein FVQ80_17410, partial [Planctomycetes bacterium]|nr:hypothetical protein [Planctomycetota bacterium]
MWSGFEERSIRFLENDLFRYMLKMGHAFLREIITLRGTGKAERAVRVGEEDLPYHMNKETTYQSVFGEAKINRAYYWRKGEKGYFPLDAELNLPYRRYSHLLDKW